MLQPLEKYIPANELSNRRSGKGSPHNIDLGDIAQRIVVLDARATPENVVAGLRIEAELRGDFSLVIIDTLAAQFDGDDLNNNVQAGDFIRRQRPATQLPGQPAVIIAAHPVKHAGEDRLVPYGGGAALNEVDGNLTLWQKPDTGIVTLHWQGKLRGLDFKPIHFRFDLSSSPDIRDAKGREVELPRLRPSTDETAEDRAQENIGVSKALLKAMLEKPDGSQREWAETVGRSASSVNNRLHGLERQKLVEKTLDRWTVTPKGRKALQ